MSQLVALFFLTNTPTPENPASSNVSLFGSGRSVRQRNARSVERSDDIEPFFKGLI
jgi:hypothetical protein